MSRWARRLGLAACAALLAVAGAQAQEKLEIFSWWNGDQGSALQALINQFNALYPDVAVTNAAAAVGPGVDAKAGLRTRMLTGDPPDSFQVRGGQDLIGTWVISERMQSLSGFYRTQGWMTAFPKDLIELLSTRSGIWSIPVDVFRCNVLWYMPARLKEWGVNPPRTWGELMNACQKLKGAGVDGPLAVGATQTLVDLWESVAVATLGPDAWSALWTGKLRLTDPRAVKVWDNFGKALDFTNPDAAGLSWQQAMDRVVKGDSAFMIQGDWAESYLAHGLSLNPGNDFAWVPSPGTSGVFVARVDSFGLPAGIRDVASTFKWLRMLGTKEAQDVFNPLNGSISPRFDSDVSRYNAYSQSAARDWRTSRIIGSLAHGMAAPGWFSSQFADVMSIYLASRDSRAAASAAQAIADQAHLGK